MRTLPDALANAMPIGDRWVLERWWAKLPSSRQRELQHLWDPRADDIAWTEDADSWEPLPIHLEGRTAEDTELGPDTRLAKQQMLEFILGHEEIGFFLQERRFHICRRHTQAHEILSRGLLPADFRCTLRAERCPMRAIAKAAGERPVRIRVRAR